MSLHHTIWSVRKVRSREFHFYLHSPKLNTSEGVLMTWYPRASSRTDEFGYLLDHRESWLSFVDDVYETDKQGRLTANGFLMCVTASYFHKFVKRRGLSAVLEKAHHHARRRSRPSCDQANSSQDTADASQKHWIECHWWSSACGHVRRHRQEVERRHLLTHDLAALGMDPLTTTARAYRRAGEAFDR